MKDAGALLKFELDEKAKSEVQLQNIVQRLRARLAWRSKPHHLPLLVVKQEVEDGPSLPRTAVSESSTSDSDESDTEAEGKA